MLIKYQVHAVRKARHMTQRQLAKRSGVSPAMISFIERGYRHPTFETLMLLAMGLGVRITELVSIADDNKFYSKYL